MQCDSEAGWQLDSVAESFLSGTLPGNQSTFALYEGLLLLSLTRNYMWGTLEELKHVSGASLNLYEYPTICMNTPERLRGIHAPITSLIVLHLRVLGCLRVSLGISWYL